MKAVPIGSFTACHGGRQSRAGTARRAALRVGWSCILALSCCQAAADSGPDGQAAGAIGAGQAIPLANEFSISVQPQLYPTRADEARYADALEQAFDAGHRWLDVPQFTLLVDRNPHVQAMLIFWGGAGYPWRLLGASPVSTGLPGRFEHFATPLGLFEHDPVHLDFRAEGTRNAQGIRGYGAKGSRVFDFGWVRAPKGWGNRAISTLRLQMHATDPDFLEPRLGTAQSKGCIRISASLNRFIDLYGLIDQAYEQAAALQHRLFWVLREDRVTGPWSGRYLVVIDSQATERPAWSPAPAVTLPRTPH